MKATWVRGLAALLVSCGLIATSAEAHAADGDVVVNATDVVYQSDNCFSSHVTVTGLDPSEDYDIEVTAPDGASKDSEYAYDQSDLTFSVLLCNGVDAVGRYSVLVDGVTASTFHVARPHFTVKRSGKRVVTGRLLVNGHGIAHRKVHVQVKVQGYWYNALKQTTTAKGRVGVLCKKHYRCAEKYRFDYRGFVHSRAFRLYTGPKNGLSSRTPATAGDLARMRTLVRLGS